MQESKREKKIWISVEALIATGKTTLLESIGSYLDDEFGKHNVVWIPEPVEKWYHHLKLCGEDPKRFSYVAQTHIFNTRFKAFETAYKFNPKATIFITERSPMSDYHVFWETNAKLHDLDKIDIQTYPQLWSTWMSMYPMHPSAYIYLELDIDECQRRQKERNRDCEEGVVTAEYQKLLQEAHERMFAQERIEPVRMDATVNYRDDPEIAKRYAAKLIDVIKAQI
jgi:deoxyadenosine/deoxycytidine kinase